MDLSALTARKTLVAAVIAGSIPAWLPQPSSAAFLPPNTRSQLLSSPSAAPTRSIPYVITPERRALLNTIRFAEAPGRVVLMWDIA